MKISTDGRCPDCGSYRVDSIPSPRQARCLNCAEDYIRLTGGEALQWRKSHPYNDGVYVDAPDATRAGSCATPGSAEEWDELSRIVGNWNVLHGARRLADQLVAWRMCAARLREFAIAHRSHPLRNPDDRLDDALAEFDGLDQSPNATGSPTGAAKQEDAHHA